AQAVTLTVAQAFKVAFEFWQASKEEKEKRDKAILEGETASSLNSDPSSPKAHSGYSSRLLLASSGKFSGAESDGLEAGITKIGHNKAT
ncbi:hypothetical protein Chor_001655, partial [Crotalus horridus]